MITNIFKNLRNIGKKVNLLDKDFVIKTIFHGKTAKDKSTVLELKNEFISRELFSEKLSNQIKYINPRSKL
jgi:hypothetical protein